MTTELTTGNLSLPRDSATGLILPLSRSLGSRALTEHSAMVALELEVMAKKMDRFGWERDRGTAAHDRLVIDWMEALRDFPLDEVRAACREWVREYPRKMPNEGDIRALVMAAREGAAREHRQREAAKASVDQLPPATPDMEARAALVAEVLGKTERIG